MIKVFEIILCMYLKTISPDVPRFSFVCSIYNLPISKNVLFITDQYQKNYWAGYIGR